MNYDVVVALKVGSIEGKYVLKSVPLHRGHEPRIVSALTLGVVLRCELSPNCKNAALISEQRKQVKPEVDCPVCVRRQHAQPIFRNWTGDNYPILVKHLRHEAKVMVIITELEDGNFGRRVLRMPLFGQTTEYVRVQQYLHLPLRP